MRIAKIQTDLKLTRYLTLALCGWVLIASASNAYADALCTQTKERTALEARVLQSELMVAALTCNEQKRYNTFIRQFKPQLISYGKELRGFYEKHFGHQIGQKKLGRLVTKLANRASQRSLVLANADFCLQASNTFDALLSATPKELPKIVANNPNAKDHGIPTCSAEIASVN